MTASYAFFKCSKFYFFINASINDKNIFLLVYKCFLTPNLIFKTQKHCRRLFSVVFINCTIYLRKNNSFLSYNDYNTSNKLNFS